MDAPEGDAAQGAGAIGSRVGVGAALLMGGILMAFATGATGLLVSIAAATGVVAAFAWFAGARVARRIEQQGRHGLPAALGLGALGSVASLGVAAVTAGLIGGLWSLTDRSRFSADAAWSYLGKPTLAVLGYGVWFAVPLGVLAGGVIFLLLWLRRRAAR